MCIIRSSRDIICRLRCSISIDYCMLLQADCKKTTQIIVPKVARPGHELVGRCEGLICGKGEIQGPTNILVFLKFEGTSITSRHFGVHALRIVLYPRGLDDCMYQVSGYIHTSIPTEGTDLQVIVLHPSVIHGAKLRGSVGQMWRHDCSLSRRSRSSGTERLQTLKMYRFRFKDLYYNIEWVEWTLVRRGCRIHCSAIKDVIPVRYL
jgi:hypothetical protein